MCLKNPECSWCEGRCREYQPTNPVKLPFVQPCCCYIYSHIVRHPKYLSNFEVNLDRLISGNSKFYKQKTVKVKLGFHQSTSHLELLTPTLIFLIDQFHIYIFATLSFTFCNPDLFHSTLVCLYEYLQVYQGFSCIEKCLVPPNEPTPKKENHQHQNDE